MSPRKKKTTQNKKRKGDTEHLSSTRKVTTPDKLKISYIDYKLIITDNDEMELREAQGMVLQNKHQIHLKQSMNDIETLNTILHEALHSLVHIYTIPFDSEEDEEVCVNKIANGLTALLRDNPKFIDYIVQVCDSVED